MGKHVNPLYTTVSVSIRRDLATRLHKMYPKYGDISELMTNVIKLIVDGSLKVKLAREKHGKPKVDKVVS